MERFSWEIGVSRTHASTIRYNFLSFLATTQALEIAFLPITWQSARQAIGFGGTSRIEEALADIQTSLAFKRIKDSEKREKSEADIFQTLTNEIMVLGHHLIREHPNIAQLQGICWDISSRGEVWPVLVFEKSQFGDLYDFARRPVWRELDIKQRLKLCIDVGSAIVDMHFNGKQRIQRTPYSRLT